MLTINQLSLTRFFPWHFPDFLPSWSYRVASGGHSVAPRWPRLVACLQRLAGGIPLSFRTWSIHLSRGRPGRRFYWSLGGRPRDRSTWQWRALCAGTSCCSLATWPKRAQRRWLITSEMDGKPVVAVTSSLRINCCQLICPTAVKFPDISRFFRKSGRPVTTWFPFSICC